MSNTVKQLITPAIIDQAMSYNEYRDLIDDLLEKGKTTGKNQSEEMVEYTSMNVHRMNRLDKHAQINNTLLKKIESVDQYWVWLVLTEAWCGDAAQNIPMIAKMADVNEHIELELILRDQHHDIIDNYLTNGGRSIPKMICLDANTLEEIGIWGPRPKTAQSMVQEMKKEDNPDKMEWIEKIQKWYAKNKTQEIQAEFQELISQWTGNKQ